MKKGLMLVLALAVTFAGSAQADDASTQKLLDKISSLEAKVSQLEGRVSMTEHTAPSKQVVPMTAPSGEGLLKSVEDIHVGGYVSSGYNLNTSSPNPASSTTVPAAGTANVNGNNTNIRAFDRDSNTFLENGKLSLEKTVTDPGTAGFRADLIYGRDAQILNSATIGDATNNLFVEQAYVHYIAPIGTGLDIKVGRFVTIAGAEVIESKDNWNTSRSLLFTNAIPFTHNGVLTSYKFSDLVDAKLGLANGWDSSIDNNKNKTILSQVNLHPMKGLDFTQNYFIGSEQTRTIAGAGSSPTSGNKTDRRGRQLLDTVIAWTPIANNDRWKVLGNYDVGWETKISGIQGTAVWDGLAIGTKYDVNDWLTLAARWEYFNDNDGARTGGLNGVLATERRNFYEMTYTADVKLAKNLITRLEWRYDTSNRPTFDLSSAVSGGSPTVGAKNGQHTIGAEMIYVFG